MTVAPPEVAFRPARLRAQVGTFAMLSPDEVNRLITATFDVIALGYIVVSGRFSTSQRRGGPTLEMSTDPKRASYIAIRKAIPFVRYNQIKLVSLSYRNPIQAVSDLGVGVGTAKGIGGFVNVLLTSAAQRRAMDAATEAQLIQNAVSDATIDVSVDERFEQLERQALDNALKHEELAQAHIKTQGMLLDYAKEAFKLQKEFGEGKAWNLEEFIELIDSVRLLHSLDLMSTFGLNVVLDDETTEGPS